jgi:glucosyl-3-phosphoglycerate synthase
MTGPDYCVVVPILNPNMAEGLVKLAAALAGARLEGEHRHIRIVILGVVTVPEETPLSQGAALVKAYRTLLRYIPQNGGLGERLEVQTEVRVARQVWQGIADQVEEENGDLLLLHWKGATQTPGKVYGDTLDALLADPPCDIVLARTNSGLPDIKHILLPVRGGSYSDLALMLASNLSEQWNATITVLHSLSNTPAPANPANFATYYNPQEVTDEPLSALQNLLAELPPGARLVTLHGQPVSGIIRETRYHDLIILGASDTKGRRGGQSEPLNSAKIAERIAAETNVPLLVVKTRRPFELSRPLMGVKAAPPTREPALEELVDRWFAENTFHYREFRTMSSLTLLKERNNLSISLVWPVYGKTQPVALAESIRRARFALMRDCALVDEIVVCAPDAQLDEAEVAAFYNSNGSNQPTPEEDEEQIIYLAPESYKRDGPRSATSDNGPGESLWHALRRTRGDIVVWGDPTVDGFEARLIYGLVGPLLSYPEFQVATGFYSKTNEHHVSAPLFSDLVELSLRPLLGGFFPQLAGVINPICTVGAARRDLLERMPLFTGPAFMPALLADTVVRSGLMSIAQVDLGAPPSSRANLPPQRIVADVLTFLMRRADERGQSNLLANFNPLIKKVHQSSGTYSLKLEPLEVPQRELPPVVFTPGYKRQSF